MKNIHSTLTTTLVIIFRHFGPLDILVLDVAMGYVQYGHFILH